MSNYSDYMAAKRAGVLQTLNPKQIEEAASMGIYPGAEGPTASTAGTGTLGVKGNFDQLTGMIKPTLENIRTRAENMYGGFNQLTGQMGQKLTDFYTSPTGFVQQTLTGLGYPQATEMVNKNLAQQALREQLIQAGAKQQGLSAGQTQNIISEKMGQLSNRSNALANLLSNLRGEAQFRIGLGETPIKYEQTALTDRITRENTGYTKIAENELTSILKAMEQGVTIDQNSLQRALELSKAQMDYDAKMAQVNADKEVKLAALNQPGALQGVGGNRYAYFDPKTGKYEFLSGGAATGTGTGTGTGTNLLGGLGNQGTESKPTYNPTLDPTTLNQLKLDLSGGIGALENAPGLSATFPSTSGIYWRSGQAPNIPPISNIPRVTTITNW